MTFLKPNLTPQELLDGVLGLLAPSEEEIRLCDTLSRGLSLDEGKDPKALLPELFLLKIGVGLEYATGMLAKLGLSEAALTAFHEMATARLAGGFAAHFRETPGHAVTTLRERVRAYAEALHLPHAEEPHLHVADRFSRYVGAADEPLLTELCLDACRRLHQSFLEEMATLPRKGA